VLVEPEVALRVDAEGRDNWSDLFERPEPVESADGGEPGAPTEGLDLSIAGLAIEDGRLSYADARRPRRFELVDVDVETGLLAKGLPIAVRAGFGLQDGDQVGLRTALRARVERVRPRVWAAEDVVVEVERPAPEGVGREPVEGRLEAARLTADLDARQYSAPELRYRLGDAHGEASLEARQGAEGIIVEGPVSLARTDLRRLLADLGVSLPQFKDPDAPGDVELKAALRYGPRLSLRDVVAVVGDTRVTGSVELGSAPGVPTRFDLRGDRITIDDYLPTGAAGAGTAQPARGTDGQAKLRKLAVDGRFAFGRVSYGKVTMSNVDGSLGSRGGILAVDPLRASVFGGTSQTRLEYEFAAETPQITLEQRLSGIDTAAMLGHLLNQQRLSGRGALTAS
jgi:AsmA protein